MLVGRDGGAWQRRRGGIWGGVLGARDSGCGRQRFPGDPLGHGGLHAGPWVATVSGSGGPGGQHLVAIGVEVDVVERVCDILTADDLPLRLEGGKYYVLGMTSVAGFHRSANGVVVLTATSGDSGDVEGEGLMALDGVDGILRRVGGDVVEGRERPGLDVGHG